MSKKQSEYLAGLLAEEPHVLDAGALAPSPAPLNSAPERASDRPRGMTLLNRESAIARVASGEVRQVTHLLLDPARVRIWPGNARVYVNLTETGCRELIDSILAEGGQKVPAVVRRVEGDPLYDYEVIAGTRRHWSISWLRTHSYPDMLFVAQVQALDDESAFRLADLENRARKDVSDLERARNYAAALESHYGGHQTRMADRLNLSKGWLSKMLKVAAIPDSVVAAFASPDELRLKPAYPLAQALDDPSVAISIAAAASIISVEQEERKAAGLPPHSPADVMRRLLSAPTAFAEKDAPLVVNSKYGRTAVSILSANRQGITVRLHAGSGADEKELFVAISTMLAHLKNSGKASLS
jgi:ParB family transcriptional regulator, chromosome partitioning protein